MDELNKLTIWILRIWLKFILDAAGEGYNLERFVFKAFELTPVYDAFFSFYLSFEIYLSLWFFIFSSVVIPSNTRHNSILHNIYPCGFYLPALYLR